MDFFYHRHSNIEDVISISKRFQWYCQSFSSTDGAFLGASSSGPFPLFPLSTHATSLFAANHEVDGNRDEREASRVVCHSTDSAMLMASASVYEGCSIILSWINSFNLPTNRAWS